MESEEIPRTHYDFYRLARAHERNGQYEEALRAYEQAIELSSDYAHAWYYKGLLLKKMGRFEDAIHCAERALELEPSWEKHVSRLIEECRGCM